MSSPENNSQEQNPFTRPAWLAAAAVVAIVVILAIVVIILNVRGRSAPGASYATTPGTVASASSLASSPAAPSTPSAAEPSAGASSAATDPDASICGLRTDLSSAPSRPKADWKYEGTTAYPSSPTYGPAKTSAKGYRYCFAHSPTGALFAAANAMVQSAGENATVWANYFVGKGPYRSHILNDDDGTGNGDVGSTRMRLDGYRMLSFSAKSAQVDLAYDVTNTDGTITASVVQSLVWQDGDWHYSAALSQPVNVGRIPDLTGYTPWGES
jgi:hypothetical protein